MVAKKNGKNAEQLRGIPIASTTPASKYIFIYNSTSNSFELRAITEADVINLSTDLASKVTGISSATDGAVVLFDTTSGKLIKDSTFVLNNFIYGNTIYGGTVIDNLDNITKTGFYTAYGSAVGVPSSGSSWFITHINSNVETVSAQQIATAYDSTDITYRRIKTANVWGSWIGIPSLIQAAINSKLSGSGTGTSTGKVYIGKADGTFSLSTLTAGTNITITNADGSITINASGGGGTSYWTALTATTDFSTTGASSSTITMNTNQTANIKIGYALKLTFNTYTYYVQVTAITASLITFRGPPITTGSGLLTGVSWGDQSRIKVIPVLMPGYYEAATVSTYINSNILSPSGFEWELPSTGYCVGFTFQTGVADGSSNGYIQLVVNGNNVSSVGASGVLVNSTSILDTGINVNTVSNTNIVISTGHFFEISVTKGTGGDAINGRLTAIFVIP